MKKPTIVKDFERSPTINFRLKKYALKAKEQATKHGIGTRLYKVKGGWSLRKT